MYENFTNKAPKPGEHHTNQHTTPTRGTRLPLNLSPEILEMVCQNAQIKIPEVPSGTGFGRRR